MEQKLLTLDQGDRFLTSGDKLRSADERHPSVYSMTPDGVIMLPPSDSIPGARYG
jgi:hypothetical protein